MDSPTWKNAIRAARIEMREHASYVWYSDVATSAAQRAETYAPGNRRAMACLVTACLIRHRNTRRMFGMFDGGRI